MIITMISLAVCMHSLAKYNGSSTLPLGIFFVGGFFETFIWSMFALAIMSHGMI